jgi:hypothetical protein
MVRENTQTSLHTPASDLPRLIFGIGAEAKPMANGSIVPGCFIVHA